MEYGDTICNGVGVVVCIHIHVYIDFHGDNDDDDDSAFSAKGLMCQCPCSLFLYLMKGHLASQRPLSSVLRPRSVLALLETCIILFLIAIPGVEVYYRVCTVLKSP